MAPPPPSPNQRGRGPLTRRRPPLESATGLVPSRTRRKSLANTHSKAGLRRRWATQVEGTLRFYTEKQGKQLLGDGGEGEFSKCGKLHIAKLSSALKYSFKLDRALDLKGVTLMEDIICNQKARRLD